MKSFLVNCFYFGLPVLVAFVGIGFLADGYTDQYYLRYTSPRQTSLILGISRAAVGLEPAIIDSSLKNEYPGIRLYNFAFMLHSSPYGKLYFDAIKKKLIAGAGKGVFIVTVDPWAIARFEGEDETQPREKQYDPGQDYWLFPHPCFRYLTGAYGHPYTSILSMKIKTLFLHRYPDYKLHDDGWLELSYPMDSVSVTGRLNITRNIYEKQFLPGCTISLIRQQWLEKTVVFLKQHGDVYLVQLPVHPSLQAISNKFYPGFDRFIDSLARRQQVPYFRFSDSCAKYSYVDGSHLTTKSAALVSGELCRLIQTYHHRP